MPTGKGFTPIIGLAVVVALAMAAVFGAMSLTPTRRRRIDSGARQLDRDVSAESGRERVSRLVEWDGH